MNLSILTLRTATLLLQISTPAINSAWIPSCRSTSLKSESLGSLINTALCPTNWLWGIASRVGTTSMGSSSPFNMPSAKREKWPALWASQQSYFSLIKMTKSFHLMNCLSCHRMHVSSGCTNSALTKDTLLADTERQTVLLALIVPHGACCGDKKMWS